MQQAPPPQMTVLSSQAMPYPVTYQPQPGSVPPQMLPGNDYADLGEHCKLLLDFSSAKLRLTHNMEVVVPLLVPAAGVLHSISNGALVRYACNYD